MKILQIITAGMFLDGITSIIMDYYRNIDKSYTKIDFASTSIIESLRREIIQNNSSLYIIKNRKKNPFSYFKKLYKIIKENKYDIVEVHGSSSIMCLEMLAAKKAGCKVRIAHSHNTKTEHVILHILMKPIFNRSYTCAFACGEEAGKWLFGNKKFTIIKNARDIDQFKFDNEIRKRVREENKINDSIVIGNVATFNYQKNHEYLIDIFNALVGEKSKKYKLILIGDGSLKQKIQDKVKKYGIEEHVIFVGKTTEVANWLQAMDIMLLTSRYEGFPNVLIEWQIAGLPCIISDKITDKVKITNLVDFQSIEEPVSKWIEKIQNTRITDRLSNQEQILNQIRINGFDIKYNARMLLKKYEDLIKEVEDE